MLIQLAGPHQSEGPDSLRYEIVDSYIKIPKMTKWSKTKMTDYQDAIDQMKAAK